jgi:hypothetical protein
MWSWVVIAACCAPLATSPGSGVIEGIVLNGTNDRRPVAEAAVVLRVESQGSWMPVAETTTDRAGRFRFKGLPAKEGLLYLPGANHMGVHYPAQRVRLKGTAAAQEIVVYDTMAEPSPLVAARHEIEIRVEGNVVTVCESILVANRTFRSYVGTSASAESPPVTLQLSIPPEFEKVTFEKEFFGRQFQLNGERLETHIPWTPGQRELKLTYRLPLETRHWRFRRPLDLPTEHVRLTIVSRDNDRIACNLPPAAAPTQDVLAFEASALPAGHAIELELGSLPLAWTAYARGAAVAALLLLVLGTSLYMLRRRSLQPAVVAATAASPNLRRPRTLPHARPSSLQDRRP